jgi:hypothetical protein
MAKVPFSKLDIKLKTEINKINFINSKGEEICFEVKYCLPIQDKIDIITKVINQSSDDNGFYNPLKVKIFTALEVVYAYTNLSFTEKQKENPLKLYDLLINSGIFKNIINNISEDDWKEIQETIINVLDNIYKYKNSAVGILENITTDYSNLELDAKNIQSMLGDTENISLLRDILTKLG